MIEQKLLLVDDQPANLVSLEAVLEGEGRTLLKAHGEGIDDIDFDVEIVHQS